MEMEKVKQNLLSKGFSEDLIETVIEEKMERYYQLKEEINNGKIRKSPNIIGEITKLEDSIVNSIEKYLKLKYPQKYSTKVVQQSGAIEGIDIDKKIEELKSIFLKK